ncbi:GAF domain-containing sensor histidine kinase [Hahella ganghwensis]|uniref:GAF domain-containing sensor histidine kinase n=1 Tax=Hahella ganghwensis TaxID=286420 RepID=UPI00036EBDB1|nr:GAF domain-containing sensor histidine kinase [Hahella ganghwensis]
MEYPSFVEDSDYIAMDSDIPEIDQLRAMLSNLTRVQLLCANKFEDFDQLIREYLIAGIEIFGLETGIVSEVTSDGVYKVRDVVSPLDVLHKGQEFPLEDTYCREVVQSQHVLGFPQVGELDYMNCHPVYQNLRLEAYLSAPIFVGDKLFGTFNFTSTTPRYRGFSVNERNLIVILANSIGAFILLRNKEERLISLNEKMKRFVGYVAHDLRNPMAAIIGYAKLSTREGLTVEQMRDLTERIIEPAERALELISTILERAALSAGKITLDITQVTLFELLDTAIESVSAFAEDASITIKNNVLKDTILECDENRMHQSLINLLINAIKYSPMHGEVDITSEIKKDNCIISITNKIDQEGPPKTFSNTPVYKSVGFGLEIVNEVFKSHGGTLQTTEQNDTYKVVLSIPLMAQQAV